MRKVCDARVNGGVDCNQMKGERLFLSFVIIYERERKGKERVVNGEEWKILNFITLSRYGR